MSDEKNEKQVKLEIRSRRDTGFRREGQLWGPDPVEASFTEEAAQRLENEPQLLVRRLDGSTRPKDADASANAPAPSPFSQHQPAGVRSTSTSSEVVVQSNPKGAPEPPASPDGHPATVSGERAAPAADRPETNVADRPDANQPAKRR